LQHLPWQGPPLAVSGIGGKTFYKDDRDAEDHVFVTFEFPGPGYYKGEKGESTKEKQKRSVVQDKDDKVIVTYSSINTNEFENYGECIDGTRGTMIVEAEQTVMLYPEAKGAATPSRSTSVTVQTKAGGARPSTPPAPRAVPAALWPPPSANKPSAPNHPAAATAKKWSTLPTASARGTKARNRTAPNPAAAAPRPWPMPLSP